KLKAISLMWRYGVFIKKNFMTIPNYLPNRANFSLSNLPSSTQITTLFKALLNKGDELRLVGGCVRDFLLGKPISDIDLACKYLPQETIKILEKNNIKVIPTGIEHGT